MARTRSSRQRPAQSPAQSLAGPQRSARSPAGSPARRGTPSVPDPGQRDPGQRDPGQRAGAGPRAAAAQVPASPAAWIRYTTLALSLAGLGVSIYLAVEHFIGSTSLACPNTGVVNCAKVTSSPESVIFGIPLPVLGLAFFAWMVAVNSPPAWRSARPELRLARLLSVVVGIAFVLYLIYAELLLVGNICLECTSIHVITFALFVLILFTATGTPGSAKRRR